MRQASWSPPYLTCYHLSPEDGAAYAKLCNDGIAHLARKDGRFFGLATVPLQDGTAAAELKRAVEQLGMRGVEIVTRAEGRELDDRTLDPFWAQAEALGVPVFIHPHIQPAGGERMGDYHLRNLVGNPLETTLAAARLLFGGVLDRFPRLQVILSHGGGALPYLIGRLEHGYRVRPECRSARKSPRTYLRRFFFDTVTFDPMSLRYLVETVGSDRVLLGSDAPFDMADPSPVKTVRAANLGAEAEARIMGQNSASLFRLQR